MDIGLPAEGLRLRIWGCRGSVPTPDAESLRYGGNTTCVEIAAPGTGTIILDAGTGIRALADDLLQRRTESQPIHIFFSHFHWDHLQGLPFFSPLFSNSTDLRLYSAHPPQTLHAVLTAQMAKPYFPVDFESTTSEKHYIQVTPQGITLGDVEITPFLLHHDGGSTGYRIHRNGRTIVFATDHEHGDEAADLRLHDASLNADLLIYDAQYTREEYPSRVGWGHSTAERAVQLAQSASVKTLILTHHDPKRSDDMVDGIVEEARQQFANTFGAAEGNTYTVE